MLEVCTEKLTRSVGKEHKIKISKIVIKNVISQRSLGEESLKTNVADDYSRFIIIFLLLFFRG